MRARFIAAAALALLSACVLRAPDLAFDDLRCGAGGRCPTGMACNRQGYCQFPAADAGAGYAACPSALAVPEYAGGVPPVPRWDGGEALLFSSMRAPTVSGSTAPGALVFATVNRNCDAFFGECTSPDVNPDCAAPFRQCTRADAEGHFSFVLALPANGSAALYTFAADPADTSVRSACSSALSAIHDDVPPVVPGVPIVSQRVGGLTIEWAPARDASGIAAYEVAVCRRCSDLGGAVVTDFGRQTSATFTDLWRASPYLFAVRARDAAGNVGEFGTAVRATTRE